MSKEISRKVVRDLWREIVEGEGRGNLYTIWREGGAGLGVGIVTPPVKPSIHWSRLPIHDVARKGGPPIPFNVERDSYLVVKKQFRMS